MSMLPYQLAFDRPAYLVLIALMPILAWYSLGSLAGLGKIRRLAAITLRLVVMLLLILALAEARLVRTSEQLTVVYLLDQSLSIPEKQRSTMIEYVNASVMQHRGDEDRVAVIVFGRDAAVEVPPFDFDVQLPPRIESLLDPEYTNMATAMKMAMALFPHDAAKRIVIITDGNQNLGDAHEQARTLADASVGIDVVPIALSARGEVAIEKVTLPSDIRKGEPFDVGIVLNHIDAPENTDGRPATGNIRVVRKTGDRDEVIAEVTRQIPPGKQVVTIREQIDNPDFYRYEARVSFPDDPDADVMSQNNRATAYTHVRGKGQVLLIEDWSNRGEFDYLVDRLRSEDVEVTVQSSDQLFTSLAELQRYDSVVLANTPRSSGDSADTVSHFSDEQIRMLVTNTADFGSGLVMMGGPNSFGAGGWGNTELEKAMPVDFDIKSAKVVPVGALALIMHASEMGQGNHWQKVVAQQAIRALGASDYCGLLFDSGGGRDMWLWNHPKGMARVGPNRRKMLAHLSRMAPMDMPDFDPGMRMASVALAALPDAAVKHMIIISDGDPTPPSAATIRSLTSQQPPVTVSTVAVGAHGPAGHTQLQIIAEQTGGKYWVVNNGAALPKIYQQEVRRVARPLVYEKPEGVIPQVKYPHEMIKGLPGQLPPITGFVLTTVKENPLVEVALVSPEPAGEKNSTLLASWTYKKGRAVALTTDAGKRWATQWADWEGYDKLFSQIVRWSMRPVNQTDQFTVATDVRDGTGQLVITALDKDDQFLNFLEMAATVVRPDMSSADLKIEQTAPGRYVGTFPADSAGSYFLIVNPGNDQAPIRTGLNVSYSDEFRDRETNLALITSLASFAPKGGKPGQVIQDTDGTGGTAALLKVNPFRRDLPRARASLDVWHLLVLVGSCTFFFDVLIRRVHISFAWVPPLAATVRDRVLRRKTSVGDTDMMERLKSRKAEVDDRIEQLRSATRFQPEEEIAVDPSVLEQSTPPAAPRQKPPQPPGGSLAADAPEESYTERLLKAKKKVWEERGKS